MRGDNDSYRDIHVRRAQCGAMRVGTRTGGTAMTTFMVVSLDGLRAEQVLAGSPKQALDLFTMRHRIYSCLLSRDRGETWEQWEKVIDGRVGWRQVGVVMVPMEGRHGTV